MEGLCVHHWRDVWKNGTLTDSPSFHTAYQSLCAPIPSLCQIDFFENKFIPWKQRALLDSLSHSTLSVIWIWWVSKALHYNIILMYSNYTSKGISYVLVNVSLPSSSLKYRKITSILHTFSPRWSFPTSCNR